MHHLAGATTIYVTHDQVEALTISSNIAVMKLGIIQQLDSPDRVYHFPSNLFVADFIGNPKVNLVDCTANGGNCIQIAPREAGIWATAVTSHKVENLGPFNRSIDEVEALIHAKYNHGSIL